MSHIWIPRAKILEPKVEIPASMGGLSGWWKLEAVRPDGRIRPLTGWFPNLILDAGLDRIGNNNNYCNACAVGTGTTAPTAADTALQSQVASTTTKFGSVANSTQPSSPYYGASVVVYEFAAGVAAGNLAEIGVGWSGSPLSLFSRSLILDSEGSPTTITVAADEVLRATYELRLYPDEVDSSYTTDISGVTYNVVRRAATVTSTSVWCPFSLSALGAAGGFSTTTASHVAYNGALGAITSSPSGSSDACTSITNATYGTGNLYRDATIVWGLSDGNLSGGISAIKVTMGQSSSPSCGAYQYSFANAAGGTPIPKNSTNILSLVFRHTWARKSI